MSRPSLPQAFADGLSLAASKRGWTAYLPLRLALCAIVSSVIVLNLPESLWSQDDHSDILDIYAGLLAFNGLLLAIGWSAFSRLYELIGSGPLSNFLKRNGILNFHILFIELAQLSLVFSSLASGFGLFSGLLPFDTWFDRAVLGASITLTCYAILQTVDATRAMNEVLWEASEFEEDGTSREN